jgi:hypothetical protein
MWLSILTSAEREANNVVIRIFEVEFTAESNSSQRVTAYILKELRDIGQYEAYVAPYVGQSFAGSFNQSETGDIFYADPNFQGEFEVACTRLEEQVVTPTEADWAALALAALKFYADEYDRAGKTLQAYAAVTQDLDAEIDKEIERDQRKADFFRSNNPEKWAMMQGRLDALRQIQSKLKALSSS